MSINITDLEFLQIEINEIKRQIKNREDFENGIPPNFGFKYVRTEYGYKIVDDPSIPYNNEEFDRLYNLAVNGKISEESFNSQIENIKFEGLDRVFKATYTFRMKNLIPDKLVLLDKI